MSVWLIEESELMQNGNGERFLYALLGTHNTKACGVGVMGDDRDYMAMMIPDDLHEVTKGMVETYLERYSWERQN